MKFIYSILILSILFSCNESSEHKTESKVADSSSVNMPEVKPSTVVTTSEAVLPKLTKGLKELTFPSIFQDDVKLDSNWTKLSKEEIENLIPPQALEEQECEVYALSKLTIDSITGVVYYLKFPQLHPEDVDEIMSKTILTLYSSNGKITDHLTLTIEDYGSGFSRINSTKEIIYVYSSEMEGIQGSKTSYTIINGRFEEMGAESFRFESTQKDFDKFHAYIDAILK